MFAKQKTPKPLTPDENGKVDHLEKDLDGFTQDHPDLSDDAQKKANGEDLEYDHVKEAEQYMRGVEKNSGTWETVCQILDALAQRSKYPLELSLF